MDRQRSVMGAMTQRRFFILMSLLFALASSRAAAADRETREFAVRVDGRSGGTNQMVISRQDDGTETVDCTASVSVNYLLVRYRYTYSGTEVWKNGRLHHLRSVTNDDGKNFDVTAWADGDGLRVRVNNRERTTRWDVWTTTYWKLADAKFRNQGVPLLDADTGKDINAVLRYVGPESVNVAGQMQNCSHYRVTGGVQVELWYDAQERLVRQESIEDGHRTVLELVRVQRQ